MKKIPVYVMLFLFPFFLYGEYTLEIRGAYYRPQSKILREKFGNSWFDFQVETSTFVCENIELFLGVDWIIKRRNFHGYSCYFSEHCCSCHDRDYLRFWLLPFTFGAKYHYFFTPCLSAYLGAGGAVTAVNIERHSYFFKDYAAIVDVGAIFKSGLHFDYGNYTFFDVFVDYFYQQVRLNQWERRVGLDRHVIDLSGLKIGLGLGVYF